MTSSGDVYRRAESGEPPSSALLDTRGTRERLQRYVYTGGPSTSGEQGELCSSPGRDRRAARERLQRDDYTEHHPSTDKYGEPPPSPQGGTYAARGQPHRDVNTGGAPISGPLPGTGASADDVDTRTETRERVDQPSSSPPPDRWEARDLRRDVNAEGPPSFTEAPFLAWKGVRAGALLPPPLPLAVVGHRSASFRVMSTLGGGGGGALPFRRQLVDVQMEASIAVTAMTGALLPPPPSRLAHGALRVGLSVTSTQGRVAGTPLVTLHWLSGAHQRDEARTHCVVIQTARHVVHAVGQTRADRRDCLTTLETRRASLRQGQRVAEGDNPVVGLGEGPPPPCLDLLLEGRVFKDRLGRGGRLSELYPEL
ncbi:hypothetical protein ACOMHN_020456 [Nucella lapillus]